MASARNLIHPVVRIAGILSAAKAARAAQAAQGGFVPDGVDQGLPAEAPPPPMDNLPIPPDPLVESAGYGAPPEAFNTPFAEILGVGQAPVAAPVPAPVAPGYEPQSFALSTEDEAAILQANADTLAYKQAKERNAFQPSANYTPELIAEAERGANRGAFRRILEGALSGAAVGNKHPAGLGAILGFAGGYSRAADQKDAAGLQLAKLKAGASLEAQKKQQAEDMAKLVPNEGPVNLLNEKQDRAKQDAAEKARVYQYGTAAQIRAFNMAEKARLEAKGDARYGEQFDYRKQRDEKRDVESAAKVKAAEAAAAAKEADTDAEEAAKVKRKAADTAAKVAETRKLKAADTAVAQAKVLYDIRAKAAESGKKEDAAAANAAFDAYRTALAAQMEALTGPKVKPRPMLDVLSEASGFPAVGNEDGSLPVPPPPPGEDSAAVAKAPPIRLSPEDAAELETAAQAFVQAGRFPTIEEAKGYLIRRAAGGQ